MNSEENRAAESNAAHIVEGGCYHQFPIPSPGPSSSPGRWILFAAIVIIVAAVIVLLTLSGGSAVSDF